MLQIKVLLFKKLSRKVNRSKRSHQGHFINNREKSGLGKDRGTTPFLKKPLRPNRSLNTKRNTDEGPSLPVTRSHIWKMTFSVLCVDDLGGQKDIVNSVVSKRAILVVVPSGKTVSSAVTKLRSHTRDMTITEHAGCSKPKIGLRKLLRSSDVVVSHLPAVRNGIKSKSFAVKDVSLLVLLDLCYSDDLFSVVPNKTECGPDIIMIFKEFPYRSDVCSLESILQYVKAKLYLTSIITVSSQTKHVLKIMYPDVVYTKDIVPVTDFENMTRLLKEYMSTTFGTYGKIEGNWIPMQL